MIELTPTEIIHYNACMYAIRKSNVGPSFYDSAYASSVTVNQASFIKSIEIADLDFAVWTLHETFKYQKKLLAEHLGTQGKVA